MNLVLDKSLDELSFEEQLVAVYDLGKTRKPFPNELRNSPRYAELYTRFSKGEGAIGLIEQMDSDMLDVDLL